MTILKRYQKGATIAISPIRARVETNNGEGYSLGLDFHLPDILAKTAVQLLTSRVYGSSAMLDLSDSPNHQLIEIKDGGHAFFLTDEHFNENYAQMMIRVKAFIK